METRISASPRAFARIFPVLLVLAFAAAAFCAALPKAAFADEPVKEGVPYAIISVSNPNLVIDLDADHPTARTHAAMAWPSGEATQAFTFTKTSDGKYYIKSYYNPSLVLTADSLSMRGAVDVRWSRSAYAQRWRLVQLEDGTFHIYSGSTDWMLDTNGQHTEDGAACIMWKFDGGDTQKWTLKELTPSAIRGVPAMPDSSDGSTYCITSVSNPETVVAFDSTANGTGVTMISAAVEGDGLQEFYFDRQIDGTYFIRAKAAPDLYLTA
ncbi:MAG: RICIN domain-containing protein, partial [Eggerthellaceae bacterium]|nr:RICIN domain-containing protein [Eggerthellaceae bacterium]